MILFVDKVVQYQAVPWVLYRLMSVIIPAVTLRYVICLTI
jgi:hypothetical protein